MLNAFASLKCSKNASIMYKNPTPSYLATGVTLHTTTCKAFFYVKQIRWGYGLPCPSAIHMKTLENAVWALSKTLMIEFQIRNVLKNEEKLYLMVQTLSAMYFLQFFKTFQFPIKLAVLPKPCSLVVTLSL